MSKLLHETLAMEVILLTNLKDRISESGEYYKLSGVITLAEYQALSKALTLLKDEAMIKADNQK